MQEEFAKNSKLIPSQRELRAVLDSPETKRLLELLRADGGTALQNAASVAGLMLTTECMVAEAPKPETPPAGMGGGMGGMGGMDM